MMIDNNSLESIQASITICLEDKLDFELYAKGVFSSLTTRKISSFTSLGTSFNLFLYTVVLKEKVNFKEKHTESN